ncbi:DUF6090 family protein [Flavobacteriaceae bacterium S0862]|nr:DUF6090 family protein [Flavobacteriaceae bacterium S0862]
MIKFFRKIRYNLMSENKTGKYFKYAIGEIILVVIGILIALQINNWNEARKAKNVEKQIYIKMLVDIKENNKITDQTISSLKTFQDLHYHLFDLMNDRASFDPNSVYGNLRSGVYFDPFFKNNYQLISQQINNNSVQEALNEYLYREDNAKEGVKYFNDLKANMVRPYLTKNNLNKAASVYTKDRYMREDLKKTIDFELLLQHIKDPEFDQILFELRVKVATALEILMIYQEAGHELEAAIEQALRDFN